MEDSMYNQPTSTQPHTHMPHPNTIHKPMNVMPRQHNLLSFLDKCYLQTQDSDENKSDTKLG